MRRWGAGVLVLMCVCLGGCLSGDPEHPAAVLDHFHLARPMLGPDGTLLDFTLIERPLGDPFLNDELWTNADCQVAGLEKKAVLEDNGICVGQVIGMNPAKLQELLESKRYCVTSRRQILPAGTSTAVTLGPPVPRCDFRVRTPDGAHDVDLEQGQCSLTIVPALTNDGRIRLKFTPQVLYGSMLPDFTVAPDHTGFQYQCKRPSKTYDALSWEVTLAPNQFLVVGTRFDEDVSEDAARSLGSQCFLVEQGGAFTQRILVIRTGRGQGSGGRSQESSLPCKKVAVLAHGQQSARY